MKVKVMFVCMGNICRSPTAHGVFRKLVQDEGYADDIYIESSGTIAYHVGEPPDSRAQQTARQRGLDMSDLRAQKVKASDFEEFDYILPMDRDNYDSLISSSSPEHHEKIKMFLSFAPSVASREVPDPYYGGASGFDQVFDMVEAGSRGLLDEIIERYQLS
ncbi:MAG: low molecular weight phosphotyrosine protein phosphatase [Gammaproteobacteria bacterium]|nr:low molecular weight phosphotyrosine protein phosphatase [Gammaproteobacteria bacterium]